MCQQIPRVYGMAAERRGTLTMPLYRNLKLLHVLMAENTEGKVRQTRTVLLILKACFILMK